MTNMTQMTFTDKKGQELIVQHRKFAVFFLGKANIQKDNQYGSRHETFVDIGELHKKYTFSEEEFKRFINYCQQIGAESWKVFTPKEANSAGTDYAEYYDSEFDNNGYVDLSTTGISIEGPYTQLKSSGDIIRLAKFPKPKFQSLVYDLLKQTATDQPHHA